MYIGKATTGGRAAVESSPPSALTGQRGTRDLSWAIRRADWLWRSTVMVRGAWIKRWRRILVEAAIVSIDGGIVTFVSILMGMSLVHIWRVPRIVVGVNHG